MTNANLNCKNAAIKDKENEKYDPYRYAAIYARKSIKNSNYSLEYQIEVCSKKIKDENLILYKVYKEEVSGNKSYLERKEFVNLLNDLYAGMFKTVVVIRMDRLSRRIDDFLRIQSIFKKHEIRTIYVNESELNIFDKSYMSKFIRNIIMSVSTFEPDNISEKTKAGKQKKRERGEYSHGKYVPYGLEYIKENKSYIVNEDEAENIRKIFKIYYENIDKVGKKDNNGKTFTKNSLVKLIKEEIKIDNRNISQNFIESIIKRPIYAKKLPIDSNIKLKDMLYYDVKRNKYDLNEKDLIECTNINDAIIDIDSWKKVVVKTLVKEIKGKREAPEYLFKKLLYCGICNKRLKKFIGNEYYTCNKGCTKLTQDEILKMLIPKLIHDCNNEDIKNKIKAEIKRLEKEINNKKKNIANTNAKIREKIHLLINNPNNKGLHDELKNLNEEKIACNKEISKLGRLLRELIYRYENLNIFKFEMSNIDDEDIKFFIERWRELHELLSNLVHKVVINKSNKNGYSIETIYTEK